MAEIKEIKLILDMTNERDKNIYTGIMSFAKKHNIEDEPEALKSFLRYLHFLGSDLKTLSDKIRSL
jgi:hypothetical protein